MMIMMMKAWVLMMNLGRKVTLRWRIASRGYSRIGVWFSSSSSSRSDGVGYRVASAWTAQNMSIYCPLHTGQGST